MLPCFCPTCRGAIVSHDTKWVHEQLQDRAQKQTSTQVGWIICLVPQSQQPGPVSQTLRPPPIPLPLTPDLEIPEYTSSEPIEQEMLDHRFLTGEDLVRFLTSFSSFLSLSIHLHNIHTTWTPSLSHEVLTHPHPHGFLIVTSWLTWWLSWGA